MATITKNSSSMAKPAVCRQTPEVGAQCMNCARWDLSGGRSVMSVPTAIHRGGNLGGHQGFRVVTTDSRHVHPVAPNVLERDFEALAPNQKWLADMTYVPTDEGWLYLALVLDLYARKLVGWAMSETMHEALTLQALDVALGWRDPKPGLVHHSDRGSQYAAKDYREKLKALGITVSMSRKGNCWDNAPMESANGTLKVECAQDAHFETREQAMREIVEYIGYYNTCLLYTSPSPRDGLLSRMPS